MRRRGFLIGLGAFAAIRCGGSAVRTPPDQTAAPQPTPVESTVSQTPTPTAVPSTPTAAPIPRVPALEPVGFPIDPATVTGLVSGALGSRVIAWGEGVPAGRYSREDQPSADPERANRCGWNARTHVAYEGQPAVDWYIPVGTPVLATLDGTATLLINTVANPFDVYGVSREPYLGNPDRSRAPIVPFSGPGGGQGVFVRVEGRDFRADFAHLGIERTLAVVPDTAFLAGFGRTTPYGSQFGDLRDFRVATAVARWVVERGTVLGFSGDSGYSEAPHLHYAIARTGAADLLCPTTEPGFSDSGWLFRGG